MFIKTFTYTVWVNIKQRCLNSNHPQYSDYGGRGITVCERWMSFENFLADMGEKPDGLSIERINNDGNYEPGNCKWATTKEQHRNTRKTRRIEGLVMRDWVEKYAASTGIPEKTLEMRILILGWTPERARLTPRRLRRT